jgi:pyridoxine/pyridoxamine 5'-phosphate oxidase
MKKAKTQRGIDCVALKRQAQEKIYADIEGMSAAEQIEYFHRRAQSGVLGAWWKQVSRLTADSLPLVVREKPSRYGK